MADKVEYYHGTTLIGTGTVAPDYPFTTSALPAGALTLTRKYYVDDVLQDEDVIDVTVEAAGVLWTPASLTNGYHWFNFADGATMTLDSTNVLDITDQIGGMVLGRTTGSTPTTSYTTLFSTNKTVFDETDGNLRKETGITTILGAGNDFEGFFTFKNTTLTENSFVSVNTAAGRFAIGIRSGALAVGVYDGSTWKSKSVAFTDVTNWHKIRFKFISGVMTAWLDGVEITGSGTVFTSVDPLFCIGSTIKNDNFKGFETTDFIVNSGAMTTQEVADSNAYCDSKIAAA